VAPIGAVALWNRPAVRQFIKFCIVGASNVVLDIGVSSALLFVFGMNWVLSKCISFLVAVSNSFYWNCRWTFREALPQEAFPVRGQGAAAALNEKADEARLNLQLPLQQTRYLKFVVINIAGFLLNLVVMKVVFMAATGSWYHAMSRPLWLTGSAIATCVCVFWNFLANKKWTFNA
jgi:putative flippase GtrA